MKNKNLYTMEQPELGKKIQELRKLKGLTQEELVEKCNINVRTIQRIEAGEVSPRSFTIKTILEVLGADSNAFFQSNEFVAGEPIFSRNDVRTLRASWIGALFFIIFTVIMMIVESVLYSAYDVFEEELIYRAIFGVLSLTALLFFLRGYKLLGERYENSVLVGGSYVYFILEFMIILATIMLTIFDFEADIVELVTGLIILVLFGIGDLILGIGILRLKEDLGTFAKIVGIAKIVNGGLFITVLLAPVAIFFSVAVFLLEAVLLFQVSQKGR